MHTGPRHASSDSAAVVTVRIAPVAAIAPWGGGFMHSN